MKGQFSYKSVLETFKEHLSRAIGESHTTSSSSDWAESDLDARARQAGTRAPLFLAGFCDACEELQALGAVVPSHSVINRVLASHDVPFHIADGTLVHTATHVCSPELHLSADQIVLQALADAEALSSSAGAERSIDRVHTAFHAYLGQLCVEAGIDESPESPTARLFKRLRDEHPALQPRGPRSADVTLMLQSFAGAVTAISTLRNKASAAHPNVVLERPEAEAVVNAVRTLLTYLRDSITRHRAS